MEPIPGRISKQWDGARVRSWMSRISPYSQPACKLRIDLGELGIEQSSAQIKDLYSTGLYKKEELLGKQILGVVTFRGKER